MPRDENTNMRCLLVHFAWKTKQSNVNTTAAEIIDNYYACCAHIYVTSQDL